MIAVADPATLQVVGSVPAGGAAEVDAAVEAARAVFREPAGAVPAACAAGSTSRAKRGTAFDHGMAIMTEETFGPTIPVMAYRDLGEAIDWVNASPYGLGATLRSTDPATIKRFYEEVEVGTVWINDPLIDNYAGPFGGTKMTGGARELGEEGLDAFLETKHVHWDLSDHPKDWWYPY